MKIISDITLSNLTGSPPPEMGERWSTFEHRLCLARGALLLFREVFQGKDLDIYSSIIQFFKKTSHWRYGECVGNIKYVLSNPMAVFLRDNERPTPPSDLQQSGNHLCWLFGGDVIRHVRRYVCNRESHKSMRFLRSWTQLKTSCAPMGDSELAKTFAKHQKALTVVPLDLDPDFSLFCEEKMTEVITNTLRRTGRRGNTYKVPFRLPALIEHEFSHHASTFSPRSIEIPDHLSDRKISVPSGASAEIFLWYYTDFPLLYLLMRRWIITGRFAFDENEDPIYREPHSHIGGGRYCAFKESPFFTANIFVPSEGPFPPCFSKSKEGGLTDTIFGYCFLDAPPSDPENGFLERHKILVRHALKHCAYMQNAHPEAFEIVKMKSESVDSIDSDFGQNIPIPQDRRVKPYLLQRLIYLSRSFSLKVARVAEVPEPLKFRLVSCGDALSYGIAVLYQKYIHSNLKRSDPFRLIGAPLKDEMITSLQAGYAQHCPKVVSGDYSAATDGINLNITNLIHRRLMEEIGEGEEGEEELMRDFKDVCNDVIGCHTLWYMPIKKGDSSFYCEQTNGQLMGSVLSFPILCIANLLTYWFAVTKYLKRSVSYRDLRVLVNGDDIMFNADDELYSIWSDSLQLSGFVKSPGKNWFHATNCTVNSVFLERKGELWKRVPFLDTDLIYGLQTQRGLLSAQNEFEEMKRLGIESLSRDWGVFVDISSRFNYGMEGSFSPLLSTAGFLSANREVLAQYTNRGKKNLFLDPCLGGVGLRPPRDWTYTVTRYQRALAYELFQNHSSCYDNGYHDRVRGPFSISGVRRNTKLIQTGVTSFPIFKKDGWIARGDKSGRFESETDTLSSVTNAVMPSLHVPSAKWSRDNRQLQPSKHRSSVWKELNESLLTSTFKKVFVRHDYTESPHETSLNWELLQ